MKKILALLMTSFPIIALCGNAPDGDELAMGFKEWQAHSHQAYSDNALGVWDCISLSEENETAVLSFKADHFVYFNSRNKYSFKLNKKVLLTKSGLKATNQTKAATLANELEFDYSTKIVSFKHFASVYGNFVNYQCAKRN